METLRESLHRRQAIAAESDIDTLCRELRARAADEGIAADVAADAAQVSAELDRNLLRLALPGGYLLWRTTIRPRGLELISVDHGPGIPNAARALDLIAQDGAARGAADRRGAPRTGLGLSLARSLSTELDIFSDPGLGTVVVARLHGAAAGQPPAPLLNGGVSLPIDPHGSGDGWATVHDPQGLTLLLVDGLGHGPKAALAADAAVGVLFHGGGAALPEYFQRANRAMRSTRGGAASLCQIDLAAGTVRFAGAGNVEGRVFLSQRSYGLTPQPGTLGFSLTPPKLRVVEGRWEPGASLLLKTDGLRVGWEAIPSRLRSTHDPAVLAALLHRDGDTGRDDATIVVVRDPRPAPAAGLPVLPI